MKAGFQPVSRTNVTHNRTSPSAIGRDQVLTRPTANERERCSRSVLDRVHPMFAHGGRLERMYPLYEALDTFLYTPADTVHGATHVRDFMDLKRIMSLVVLALVPCILFGCWNTGYQAHSAVATAQAVHNAEEEKKPEADRQEFRVDSLTFGYWQAGVMRRLGFSFQPSRSACRASFTGCYSSCRSTSSRWQRGGRAN